MAKMPRTFPFCSVKEGVKMRSLENDRTYDMVLVK